jgi:mono/diheme cytochrome c family protein
MSQGFDEQTIRDVVRGQIAYPEEPMPANLVEGQDADDLAAYIAKCAGKADCGVTASRSGAAAGGNTGAQGGSGTTATPQGAPKPDGKQIFASAGCSGCHTLEDAGASGNVGPNLDELKPSKDQVAKQVANGGGGMPAYKGRLSDTEIAAVAAYVSGAAGK